MLKVITPKQGGINKYNKLGSGSKEPLPKTTAQRQDKLAKAVGFKSEASARRAKKISRDCVQGISDLVDEGETDDERVLRCTLLQVYR